MRIVPLSTWVNELESGARPKGGIKEGIGEVPSLGAEHLADDGGFNFVKDKRVPYDFFCMMKKGHVQPNDILIVKDGATTGKVSFVTDSFPYKEAAINEHVFRLTVNRKKSDPRFVFRYLQSPQGQEQIMSDYRGATVGGIGRTFLDKVFLPDLDLSEQRRIAAILDKADAIRLKYKQTIALTDDFLKSVFLEMFGDPVKNQKCWPTKTLGLLGEIDRGKSRHRPRNDPRLLGGPYPLIQTGDVANADYTVTDFKSTYSEFGLAQSRLWPRGTLCITIAANIADSALLGFDACFPDSIVGFSPGGDVTSEYVKAWLEFLRETISQAAPQSAQKNINLRILRELSVPTPPIELQRRFSKIVTDSLANKERQLQAHSASSVLFASLSQRAFRGEL